MGETIFRFGLKEIATFRVRCKQPQCGIAIDIPSTKAASAFSKTMTCPACGNHMWEQGESGKALHDFQDAIRRISEAKLDLDFIVPKASVESK
jgi:hypothetical protein